jgi:hypothetical protein
MYTRLFREFPYDIVDYKTLPKDFDNPSYNPFFAGRHPFPKMHGLIHIAIRNCWRDCYSFSSKKERAAYIMDGCHKHILDGLKRRFYDVDHGYKDMEEEKVVADWCENDDKFAVFDRGNFEKTSNSSGWSYEGFKSTVWGLISCTVFTGNLELLEQLHEDKVYTTLFTSTLISYAALDNQLKVLEFLFVYRSEVCEPEAFEYAAILGHRDFYELLFEPFPFVLQRMCGCKRISYSAKVGSVDVIECLLKMYPQLISSFVVKEAANYGHLNIVQFMANQYPQTVLAYGVDISDYRDAAENGFLDLIKFIHKRTSTPCDKSVMDLAAKHNHLDIVSFLHENRTEGGPWMQPPSRDIGRLWNSFVRTDTRDVQPMPF